MNEKLEVQESYEPTPLEIWLQCSDIQATWAPDEERRRRGATQQRWRPPGCKRVLRVGISSRIEIQ